LRKKSWKYYLVVIFLGALIGSVLGEIAAYLIPEGVVKDFFLKSAAASFDTGTISIIIITVSLGLSFKLNIMGVIGILIAAYALRWVD
jgi:hypothetical protein